MQGAEQAALNFAEALQQAYQHIAQFPGTGSSRYEEVVQIAGLRFWRVPGYPHLVFYIEEPERILIVRILHGQRDIPASFCA